MRWLVKQRDFDLIFIDLKMPGMIGDELFGRIKAIKPRLPVTIITGYPDSGRQAKYIGKAERVSLGTVPYHYGQQWQDSIKCNWSEKFQLSYSRLKHAGY